MEWVEGDLLLAALDIRGHRQALAAFFAAALQNKPSTLSRHASAKAVGSELANIAWLKGAFHSSRRLPLFTVCVKGSRNFNSV